MIYGARLKYWAWLIVAVFMLLVSRTGYAAGLFDGKYSQNQVFDVARSGCGSVGASCYVYNFINPFIAPYTNWTNVTWAAGDYVQFYDTGAGSNNIGMKQYASNGTYKGIISSSGYVQALGDGILYIGVPGTGGGTGYFISNSAGYSYGGSATFTVQTLNPTMTQMNSYSASSTPLAAGQTAAPATPTVDWKTVKTNSTPVVISNIYPTSYNSPSGEGATNAFDGNTSTKYLNFDKKNAGVTVRLSQGRVVQKFTITTANDFSGRDPTSYKLYGSNDGVNWTLIKQDTLSLSETRYWTSPEIATGNTTAYVYYFILFPTTKSGDGCGLNCDSMQIAEVTYYYDLNDGVTSTDLAANSTPSNPGQAGSVCSDCFASEITAAQLAELNAAKTRRNAMLAGNRIDLEVSGPTNSVTIEQVGQYNKIQGLGGGNAWVGGFTNSVNIKQGDSLSGRNLIEYYSQGNGNNVTISQARDTTTGAQDGQESGGHIIRFSATGNSGTYVIRQGNDGGANSGHFLSYTMQGGGGTHTVKQSNNNEKQAFVNINGSYVNETVLQSGTGSHYLDLTLTGNSHNVNITQKDAGSHKATINLTNAGGASSLSLVQQGNTAQVYSITQQCATLSGCSVSVTQGTGP